jgi:hypothetical protein
MNPLMKHTDNGIEQIRNMMNMYQNLRNPQAMLQNLCRQNPMLASVVNASGGNLKDAFYKLCNQQGVNPDDILNQLK